MKMYKFKQHPQYRDVFAIVTTVSGTYVCPGWYPVEPGTKREQIEFEMIEYSLPKPKQPVIPDESWEVAGSKPGSVYEVTLRDGIWSCTCPSKTFHRGDCKHIKSIKTEKSLA